MLVLISLFIFKSEVMKSPFQASNDIRLKTVTIYFRKEENPSTILLVVAILELAITYI